MHSDASSHRKVQPITVAVVSWQFITSFPVMCKMVAGQPEEMRAKDCGKCPLISDPLRFPSKHCSHVLAN